MDQNEFRHDLALGQFISFPKVAEGCVGGDVKAFLDAYFANGFGSLAIALTGLALAVFLSWFLYRKKSFLRV